MKQKHLIASLFIAGSFALGGGLVANSQPAYAADPPKCAILPQAICNASTEKDPKKSGITQILSLALNILTAVVGIAAVGAFVYAGFLYASAGDKADQVSKSKQMMIDITVGLVVYAALYLGIQWLLPGNVLG